MISLETHNEKNVAFYRQFGFKVFVVMEEHFDLKQYGMIREVRKPAASLPSFLRNHTLIQIVRQRLRKFKSQFPIQLKRRPVVSANLQHDTADRKIFRFCFGHAV